MLRGLQASLFEQSFDSMLKAFGRTSWGAAIGLGNYGAKNYHGGGIVDGPTGADVNVVAQAGELILTKAQQGNVAAGLQGGGGFNLEQNISVNGEIGPAVYRELMGQVKYLAQNSFQQMIEQRLPTR